MDNIDYSILSDIEKLSLLQLLYYEIKKKNKLTVRDTKQKELIVAETQRVYSRIKLRSN
jgi:hypothetical protein